MKQKTILSTKLLKLTLLRLSHQLIENHNDFSNSVIIGLQPRGIFLARRIKKILSKILNKKEKDFLYGELDVTFYRDDFRRRKEPLKASSTQMDFIIENKKVILIDDVLFTGRTVRAGLDALLAYGRPQKVELLVLIDRRFSRHLPIQANYVGHTVDAVMSEKVKVLLNESGKEKVILYTQEK